jgi:hypothetical protein
VRKQRKNQAAEGTVGEPSTSLAFDLRARRLEERVVLNP